MKIIFIFFSLLSVYSMVYAQENYTLTIDGKQHSIKLGETKDIQNGNDVLNVSLILKDTLTYANEYFSINYPKEYGITEMDLDVGVTQLMIMSAEGNGLMIQHYLDLDPSMLKELMLSELTKESKSYGYEYKREDYTRTLSDGSEINVIKAVMQYKNETTEYEVASIGKRDEGLLIITINQNTQEILTSHNISQIMWQSLEYK